MGSGDVSWRWIVGPFQIELEMYWPNQPVSLLDIGIAFGLVHEVFHIGLVVLGFGIYLEVS